MNRLPYRTYLVGVLMVILTFNFVDRYALGLVLERIKTDLHLSDTQLGLLSGLAFALFYSLMGIPIARWADRGNRVTIISLTAVLWSVMVSLCGVATNFVQMLLIRIGVGVGEAGCIPPAHSLIADYFNRAERPRAMGIYMQGINVSLLIGYFVAGWLSERYGWRNMFMLLSLPGISMAVVAWLTLREPRRVGQVDYTDRVGGSSNPATQPSMKEVFLALWGSATFRHLLYFHSLWFFFSVGQMQWQPAFIVRSFGLNTGELGAWLAIVYTVPAIAGTHWGGVWASRRAPANECLQLKIMAIMNAGFNGIIWALVYFAHNYYVAFALMALSTFGAATLNGPVFSTIQTLVPSRMRAMSIAVIYLFANLIGMGLGPLAVGVLSDALRPLLGEESLRYALLALCPGYLWASWHLWRASRTVTVDLAAIRMVHDGDDGAGRSLGKCKWETSASG